MRKMQPKRNTKGKLVGVGRSLAGIPAIDPVRVRGQQRIRRYLLGEGGVPPNAGRGDDLVVFIVLFVGTAAWGGSLLVLRHRLAP